MQNGKENAMVILVVLTMLTVSSGTAAASHSLDCETNRNWYFQGMPVEITCTNNGDHVVVTGVTFFVTRRDGTPVYNPVVPAIAVGVPPGEAVEHTWDQTFVNSPLGADGEQVPPGIYFITVQNGGPARIRIADKGYATIDQGTLSGYDAPPGGENLVIRDQASWEIFWAAHTSRTICLEPPCPGQDPPEVDFQHEMVIAAMYGPAPTSGYGVAVVGVVQGPDRADVFVAKTSPCEGCPVLLVATRPFHIVTTDIADDVRFHDQQFQQEF